MAHLGFDEMTYPDFGHDGNGNRIDDFFDHARVTLQESGQHLVIIRD